MSRGFGDDTRWRLTSGTTGSYVRGHVREVKVDEMEDEMRHIERFKCKNSQQNRTDFLTEKFSDLRVVDSERKGAGQEFDFTAFEPEILKQSETFTDISITGLGYSSGHPKCTASQSLCQIPPGRLQGFSDSSPFEGQFPNFVSFPDKLNLETKATGYAGNDDVMDDDVMTDTSWTPALLRRISSPRISKETFSNHDDMLSGDFRFTASDSDSMSRVSFLLDEPHHVTNRNRKTQSMTNFLDLNSDVISCSDGADGLSSICRLSLSESDLDVTTSSLTYQADVSDNVPSDDVMTPYQTQTQSPQSTDSMLDTPSEVKALTHNSLGRHDGDVIKDYQRSKSLDALRKRKRGRVASFRQSAISMANHVIGVFKRVKDADGESRSSGKHKSPKKMKAVEGSPEKRLFNLRNNSILSSTSSSDYEINMH